MIMDDQEDDVKLHVKFNIELADDLKIEFVGEFNIEFDG